MSEVVHIQERQPTIVGPDPMMMIAEAVNGGADVAVIEKLMALQERWQANQGRAEFDRAMAAAKAEIGPIIKTSQGHNYKYEDLAAIARAVDPVLAEQGLSYRYRTQQTETHIRVTCIIAHRDGHSEETTLQCPPDEGPQRNLVQAIGSAVTYLQRYTLKAALGLSASKDDDGQAAGGRPRRLPKARARDIYKTMQEDMDHCQSEVDLDEWKETYRGDLKTLPEDWEQELHERGIAKRDKIRAAAAEALA